jgi:hypothetical protein
MSSCQTETRIENAFHRTGLASSNPTATEPEKRAAIEEWTYYKDQRWKHERAFEHYTGVSITAFHTMEDSRLSDRRAMSTVKSNIRPISPSRVRQEKDPRADVTVCCRLSGPRGRARGRMASCQSLRIDLEAISRS